MVIIFSSLKGIFQIVQQHFLECISKPMSSYEAFRNELKPDHPEYKERLTALNKLIAGISRKQKFGRGVGSNVMEKIKQ
mgnify:CR=1 FL=1